MQDPFSQLPKIWFLRHGETEWNAIRRIQGQLESDLTERGRADAARQARLIAPVLMDKPPLFVSPLGRAQQTARIAFNGTPYETDDRLSEAHAGDWQGLLRDDVRRDHPDIFSDNTPALELFVQSPGGESFEAFQARITDFLMHLDRPSVLVGHGLWGQIMRGLIRGLSREEMGRLPNEQGCVYVLEDGQERVLREE